MVRRFINADGQLNTDAILGSNLFAYCYNNSIVLKDSSGNRPIHSTSVDNEDRYKRTISCQFTKEISTGTSVISGGVTYELSKGWSARIDAENTNTKTKKHIHISKNGKEYSQNVDGEPHDGSTGTPPKKVLNELKNVIGWDWNKKAQSWINKNNFSMIHSCSPLALENGDCTCYSGILIFGPNISPIIGGSSYTIPVPVTTTPYIPIPIG